LNLKRVIVETPYKAKSKIDLKRNLEFAQACARDCLVNHQESPFLSHLLYTQPGILDDNIPEERQLGIDAGLAWGEMAEATVVYLESRSLHRHVLRRQKCPGKSPSRHLP